GNREEDLKDYAIIDSGCSGSMTGDKDKLSDFKEFKDFEKVSYVEELKFNLLSVSQIYDLEAFSDSDYAGDNHDTRSTSGGCQYLGRRLVSWQCKKQTIVAISSTEAEYVATASCCAQ
ncbi:putative ribonuclease H-like domain-containing protein, partial [Tanacetum coccineum]